MLTGVPTPECPPVPCSSHRIERFTLGNGLRVVLNPDRSIPVIGVAVVYDVGVRSEPRGRSGFAHLFEHLMFQGSASLEKLAHARCVEGSGGTFNGSTNLDYTEYFEMLPSNALDRALFLEADRMRGPRLTEQNLRNQVDVVKAEIRIKVLSRPYGGFPGEKLSRVIFDRFPNAHDGYGSFTDLDTASLPDAVAFFDRYYTCGNAVLSVAGDFDPDRAARLAERNFGDVPAHPAPSHPDLAETQATEERHASYMDPLAPLLAIACAWRVPDPITDVDGYLPFVVLAAVLADGDASRLAERLVLRDRCATSIGGAIGFTGVPFGVRDPTVLLLQAHLPAGGAVRKVLAAIDAEIDRLTTDGLARGELGRTQARLATNLLQDCDSASDRAVRMAVLELQRDNPALINDLPHLVASVTEEEVRAAASTLVPWRRACVEVVPGAGQ